MADMHGDNIGAALGVLIAMAAVGVVVWVGLSVLRRRRP